MLSLLVREKADWIPPPPPSPPLDEILYVTIIGVAIKTSTTFLRLKSHIDFQLPGCFIQIIFRSSTLLLFKLSVVCHFQLGEPGLLFECRGQKSHILHNTLIPYSIPYSVPYSVPFRIPHFTRYLERCIENSSSTTCLLSRSSCKPPSLCHIESCQLHDSVADPGILKGRGPAAISSKRGGGGLLGEICIKNKQNFLKKGGPDPWTPHP